MQLDIGWKITLGMVLASVVGGVYIITEELYASKRAEDGIVEVQVTPDNTVKLNLDEDAPAPKNVGSESSAHFIGECSGMDLSQPRVHIAAVSECVGRIRGFVDGHNLTTAMVRSMNKRQGEMLQLFCVNPNIESDVLVADIMDWVDNHQDDYVHMVATSNGEDITTIVMIKALKETYPCANT